MNGTRLILLLFAVLSTVDKIQRFKGLVRVSLARQRGSGFPIIFFDNDVFGRSGIEKYWKEPVVVRGTVERYKKGDYQTRAGEDGTYSFGFVAAGGNRLVLRGRDWQVALDGLEIPESGSMRHDVQLRGTARIAGVLRSDAPPQTRVVELYRIDELEEHYARVWPHGNGAFAIPHLEAGTYRLVASARNTAKLEREIVLAPAQQLDLGELATVGHPKVPLTIKVPAGREIPSIMFCLAVGEESRYMARIDLDNTGRGHLSLLPPGTYRLSVAPPGCKRLAVTVTVTAAGGSPLHWEFEKAPLKLTVPITLIAPSGFELPDVVQIAAAGIDGTEPGLGFVSVENGTLSNLPEGKYGLNFQIEGLKHEVVVVEISAGMKPIRVELTTATR